MKHYSTVALGQSLCWSGLWPTLSTLNGADLGEGRLCTGAVIWLELVGIGCGMILTLNFISLSATEITDLASHRRTGVF